MSLYDLIKAFEAGVSLFYGGSAGSIKRALDGLELPQDVSEPRPVVQRPQDPNRLSQGADAGTRSLELGQDSTDYLLYLRQLCGELVVVVDSFAQRLLLTLDAVRSRVSFHLVPPLR